MTIGYDTITFGTQALEITSLSRRKVPSTVKQKVGMNIIKHQIPSRSTQDWEITVQGVIYDTGTYATAKRVTLEAYNDKYKRHYSDGLITGSFIIDDLSFDDSPDTPMHYIYRMSLIEYNQA